MADERDAQRGCVFMRTTNHSPAIRERRSSRGQPPQLPRAPPAPLPSSLRTAAAEVCKMFQKGSAQAGSNIPRAREKWLSCTAKPAKPQRPRGRGAWGVSFGGQMHPSCPDTCDPPFQCACLLPLPETLALPSSSPRPPTLYVPSLPTHARQDASKPSHQSSSNKRATHRSFPPTRPRLSPSPALLLKRPAPHSTLPRGLRTLAHPHPRRHQLQLGSRATLARRRCIQRQARHP